MSEIQKYIGEELDKPETLSKQLDKQDDGLEVEASVAPVTELGAGEIIALSLDDIVPRSWKSWE